MEITGSSGGVFGHFDESVVKSSHRSAFPKVRLVLVIEAGTHLNYRRPDMSLPD